MGSNFHSDHPGLVLPRLRADPVGPGTYLNDGAIGTNSRSRRAVAVLTPPAIEWQSAKVASSEQFNRAQFARVTSVLHTAHETSLDQAEV